MRSTIKTLSLFLFGLLLFTGTGIPSQSVAQERPLVLAFYYAWFDQNSWSSGQSVDLPAQPYSSADRATIERHVAQAQSAGLDAFVQSWYGPQEANNQTETNFRILLEVAQAQGFKAAVDVETTSPFFGDVNSVTNGLVTLLASHVQHPAYLRYQGKPVIFFWRQQRFSVDTWAAIRNQVDPNHTTYWIAEGVDIAYQAVFDGHHLYSIAWAASPADQLAKWSNRVQAYETKNGVNRLWVATAMPGYDDTRLPRQNVFAVPRRGGDYYRETWQGAVASQPDMIVITSFNEWLEGTQIEPSGSYGNLYLDVTRELVTTWRGQSPAAPAPAALAVQPAALSTEQQLQEEPPDGPYIEVEAVTNVRRGPGLNFGRVGTLPAGSSVAVTGRNPASDWWQIDFEIGPEGKAWVSADVVTFVGEAAAVPEVDPPPPPEAEGSADEPGSEPTPTPVPPTIQVPAGGANVRRGPGLDFELLGRLEENETAVVTAKNETEEWWQIEYEAGENELAWVAAAVVDLTGEPDLVPFAVAAADSEAAVPVVTATPTATVPLVVGQVEAIEPVNVRADPSLDGTLVGGLYPGETAEVLALSQDEEWWQIEFADGPEGLAWVSAEFVRFEGDEMSVPIFGVGTVTPTPGPTDTPTATPNRPTATPIQRPATFAPTATSIYQATSAALLTQRSTPDPSITELPATRPSSFQWGEIPWGILSIVVVVAVLWYQFYQRRRGKRRKNRPKF